jgi:predicted transcriptional regulator
VIFSRPVDVIIVYATSPVQQVAFEFDVASVIHEPLSTLWKLTRDDAGINKALFSKYFEGCQKGYAIQIGEIRRYETPFSPLVSYGLRPPQSFVYLNKMKQKQTYLLTGFIAI